MPSPACLVADAGQSCGRFVRSVEHPASSPYVTAVGGTNLVTTADPGNPHDLNSVYASENAHFDWLAYDAFYGTPASGAAWGSRGGVSLFEPKPAWQELAPRRSGRASPTAAATSWRSAVSWWELRGPAPRRRISQGSSRCRRSICTAGWAT